MHKCTLEVNKLANVDFLSLMYLNRSLIELELIDQRFGKEKPAKQVQTAAATASADLSSDSDDGP